MVGIGFLVLGEVLYHLFPMDMVAESIGVATSLSFLPILGVGIITIIRERREKKEKGNIEGQLTKTEFNQLENKSEIEKKNTIVDKEKRTNKQNKPTRVAVISIIVSVLMILIILLIIYYPAILSPQKENAVAGQQDQEQQSKITKPVKVEEGSSQKNFTLAGLLVGHWRNDTAKLDYIFCGKQNILSIVRENDSSDCTYEINKTNEEKNYLEIVFNCPQPDWPGYAEEHTIEFSKNRDSFVNTMYIQGIAQRIEGNFTHVGTMDTCSKN